MKPIDKMTLTEVAAEIQERMTQYLPGLTAQRAGSYVRIMQPGELPPEQALSATEARFCLAGLRLGWRLRLHQDTVVALYLVDHGVVQAFTGRATLTRAWVPLFPWRQFYLTRLQAAEAHLKTRSEALKKAQAEYDAAVSLVAQERLKAGAQ